MRFAAVLDDRLSRDSRIEPGAQVRTDGSAAYRSLGGLGYDHQP